MRIPLRHDGRFVPQQLVAPCRDRFRSVPGSSKTYVAGRENGNPRFSPAERKTQRAPQMTRLVPPSQTEPAATTALLPNRVLAPSFSFPARKASPSQFE
mgnify:CR=1 FL=1